MSKRRSTTGNRPSSLRREPGSSAGWTFTTEIDWVDGAEGEWLRHELAVVVRALLVWAWDDMSSGGAPQHEEKRRAA
jgi:hypothetical protein